MIVRFSLNGKAAEYDVPGQRRLLDFLREDLHLTGTKEGCGIGECGACTVILNRKAVHACLTTVGQVNGGDLWTVEGLQQNGEFDRVQKAFLDCSAFQCGFCTGGMIMSVKALLLENPNPADEEIRRAIAGNVCRCTGYQEIRNAVRMAAKEAEHGT